MISPRWCKVARDLLEHRSRSVLLLSALVIGVVSVGTVLNSFAILDREIDRNYRETQPASATVHLERVDEALLTDLRHSPLINAVEPRGIVMGRLELAPNEWISIRLFVIENFASRRAHVFSPEAGIFAPAIDQILIERSALTMTRRAIGESVVVKLPGGPRRTLEIAGTVHDAGQAPAWMEGQVHGYVTPDTARELGAKAVFNRIYLMGSENPSDRPSNLRMANAAHDILSRHDVEVSRIEVPVQGRHPHYDQMQSFKFLLKAFAALASLLSGLLVATVISAHMTEQRSQIAIMKALGAQPVQIAGIYVAMIGVLGVLAALVAMPLARLAAWAYTDWAMATLNFTIASYSVDVWVNLAQLAASILLPTLASMWPILKASRESVWETLQAQDIESPGWNGLTRVFGFLQQFSLPALFVVRNGVRRPGRSLASVVTLAVGGAVFTAALNVREGWFATVDEGASARNYDLVLRLDRPYQRSDLRATMASVSAVEEMALWETAIGGKRARHNRPGSDVSLLGVPVSSSLLRFPVIEGRWLQPGDRNALVVTNRLLRQRPELHVGSEISLPVDGNDQMWHVVGVVRDMISSGAYANLDTVSSLTGSQEVAQVVAVRRKPMTGESQSTFVRQVEAAFADVDIEIASAIRTDAIYQSLIDHVEILVNLLMLIAVSVALVGGLGLMSAIRLNTLERTREIGVLRAIGAGHGKVLWIVCGEGLVLGVFSWVIAILASLPLTQIIGRLSGEIFIGAPIAVVSSFTVFFSWGALILVITFAASYPPARRAVHWPVRRSLSYVG